MRFAVTVPSSAPARYWLPLPAALLLSFVIWEARWLVSDGPATALKFLLPTVTWGLGTFPIGLVAPWLSYPRSVTRYLLPIAVGGYAVYILLSVIAGWKRSSFLLALLAGLLALNVVGCQFDASLDAIGIE